MRSPFRKRWVVVPYVLGEPLNDQNSHRFVLRTSAKYFAHLCNTGRSIDLITWKTETLP